MRKNVLAIAIFSSVLILSVSNVLATNCPTYDNDQTSCISFDDCTWMSDPWGSWCSQKGCWNFWTQATCQNSTNTISQTCNWKSGSSGWCEQAGCWYFIGTNQTACVNNTYNLNCQWNSGCMGTGGGAGTNCWNITDASTCGNTTGCAWGDCYSKGCWGWSTQAECTQYTGFNGRSCKWNSGDSYCYEQGCWDYTNSTSCAANNCTWSYSSCMDPTCATWDYTNATACVNNTAGLKCSWSSPYCNMQGCWNFQTQNTCEAVSLTGTKCVWKNQNMGWCEETNCWSFDNTNETMCETNATQLYSLSCEWETNNHFCFKNITNSLNCSQMTTDRKCMDTFYCWWDFGLQQCNAPGQITNIFVEWNPGCYIFDMNQTECTSVIGCYWSNGACQTNTTIIPNSQINCTLINESTMCNSIPALSTCCKWQGSTCGKDWSDTTCRDQMKTPPTGAAFCEDYNSYDSQTLCEQIAGSPWFMPCKWNNATQHCEFKSDKVFGAAGGGFVDIDNKMNCESMSGKWITDSYCEQDPTNASKYVAVSFGHCEHKFEEERNCNKVCYACDSQQDGSSWGSLAEARTACENSKSGVPPGAASGAVGWCQFSNFTSQSSDGRWGECKQNDKFKQMGGKNCNEDCGTCTFFGKISQGEPQMACAASAANCKWFADPKDTNNGWCGLSSEKSCSDKCDQCYDQTSCMNTGSGGNGACSWDTATLVCKPSSGATSMETCFDGVDNDGNGMTDCADSKCYTDPFCGGAAMFTDFGVDCFGFSDNSSCVNSGCKWMNENWGSWCDMPGAVCWKADGTNETYCENNTIAGVDNCEWHTGMGGFCEVPKGAPEQCFGANDTTCALNTNCIWMLDNWCSEKGGWCDPNPSYAYPGYDCAQYDTAGNVTCESTGTADSEGDRPCKWYVDSWCQQQGANAGHCEFVGFSCWQNTNITSCQSKGYCSWKSDPYSPQGGYCDGKCFNPNLNQQACTQTNLTAALNCTWVGGFCDPKGFGGEMGGGGGGGMGPSCFKYDGNQTQCNNQTGCKYFEEATDRQFCDVDFSNDCPQYSFDQTGGNCSAQSKCKWNPNQQFCDEKPFECFWNETLKLDAGNCNANSLCYWNTQWGSCEPICFNSTKQTENACIAATGCKWKSGWCDPAMGADMFSKMEMGAAQPLGMDICPEGSITAESDICGFGMKDMKDGWGFGIGVSSIENAAFCNGVKTGWGATGSGTNTTKFFWYLDTDGSTTGNCQPNDRTDIGGFEFYFKYVASWDTSTGQVSETRTAYKCVDGQWGVSDIKLSSKKEFMCSEIRGGMIAVDKADLNKFSSLFVPGSDIRVYVTTADGSHNVTNPSDSAGPGYGTPGAIDFKPECCWKPGSDCDGDNNTAANDPDCADLMKKGFVEYEDCMNGIDDDNNGYKDCNDPQCRCGESDCSDMPYCANTGVNAAGYVDTKAPTLKSIEIEPYSDAALIMYYTDEPANGTLIFYQTSSSCSDSVAQKTNIYDSGILYSTVRTYKTWHDAELYDAGGMTVGGLNVSLPAPLINNGTYYYKLKMCDKSGNCGLSACLDFITSALSSSTCSYCNFVTKIDMPTGWNVSYDANRDGTYEHVQGQICGANAGMKTNYTVGRHVDIKIEKSDGTTWMKFLDVRLTRSGMGGNWKAREIDQSGITSGSSGGYSYTGFPRETRDKIINNLHPKKCQVKIPGTSNQLWHCTDDLGTCTQIANAATLYLNESGSNYRIWDVPYCEFSVWSGGNLVGAGATTTTTPGGNGGGSGGGGAGGGKLTKVKYTFKELKKNIIEKWKINQPGMGLIEMNMTVKNPANNVQITIEKLSGKPAYVIHEITGKVYQYIEINKTNLTDSDIDKITFKINVNKSWITSNNIDDTTVAMNRYTNDAWEKLKTTKAESDSNYQYYIVETSGLSAFAIAAVTTGATTIATTAVTTTAGATTAVTTTAGETTIPSGYQTSNTTYALIIILVIIAVAIFFIYRRKA